MLDVAPTELLLIAAVALIVIGPKDLPNVMRTVGRWVGKARGVASHFRSGFDQMVREAEIEEMEKRWAAENARIMREHPAPAETDALPAPLADDGPPPITTGVAAPAYDDEPLGPYQAEAPAPVAEVPAPAAGAEPAFGPAPGEETDPPSGRPLP